MSTSDARPQPGIRHLALNGSNFFIIVPALIACSAALGWWLNLPWLRNPYPEQPPVAPTTSVCLLALCIAITLRESPRQSNRKIAFASSVMAITIGSLVALHYLLPHLVDIDQWCHHNSLPAFGFAAGRMSPNTAVCVVLLGIASLCRSVIADRMLWIWHICVVGVLAAATTFVIGFLYRVSAIYEIGAFTPMALPTAVSLLLLACAELAARKNLGLMRLLTGDGEGSYSMRRLLPAVIGLPVLLGYLDVWGEAAGWFDSTLGVTLLVLLMILSFSALIIRNAILLNSLTHERDKSLSTIRCLYEDLTDARDRAVQAVRIKSQFLANMSHEIRTPMNAVIGCADMLQRTNLSSDQKRFVDIVMSSASTLVNIINDILELSKIEADKLELQMVPINIIELLESTARLVAEKAQSKGISLTTYIDPVLDRTVTGDPQRIRQVMLNILSNAVKFTEQGSVTLTVEPEAVTEHGLILRMSVADTGIGMREQYLSQLFKPFSQCDGSVTRKYGGTGLGLAICRRLVELMGGSINVESSEGEGSTFSVTLPLAYTDDTPPLHRRRDVAGLKLLVVGSPANEYSVLKGYSEAWEMQADYAPDAQSAMFFTDLAASASKPYSIVICEQLIGSGGLEAYALRDLMSERSPHLRFVLLSDLDQVGKTDEAQARGFDAVLSKPIRQSDLYDAIVTLAESVPAHARHVAGRTAGGTNRVDTFSSELPADACRRILVVEDNPINQEVASLQLRELGFDPQLCSGGQQALTYLRHHRVALILMDCQMPDMDGFETTAAIRAMEEELGITTPIVAMTANSMEGDREECLETGMNDYIGKPVTAEKLKEVIERWFLVALDSEPVPAGSVEPAPADSTRETDELTIKVREQLVDTARGSSRQTSTSQAETRVAMEQLVALFGKAAAERFLTMFLVQTPPLIEKIEGALRTGDTERLKSVAHELKGSCFAINCHSLAEICYEIERCARAQNIGSAAIAESKLEREFCRVAKDMEAWIHARSANPMPSEILETVRVFLVEDNELTRMGISTILDKLDGLSVCGDAEDGVSAIQAIVTARPDVAVVDIGLPGLSGIEVTRRVKAIVPKTKVLILTSHDDDEDMFSAFAAGADGYVTKHSFDRYRLELAIRTVHSGACWLDPIIARRILTVASSATAARAFPGAEETYPTTPLSDSERTLLHAVATDSENCHLGVCQVDPSFLERLQRFGARNGNGKAGARH